MIVRTTMIAVAALAAVGTAQAGEPAALVLDIAGATVPAVQSYSEVAAGTRLVLDADSRVSFVHYGTCRLVTLVGGEVRLDRSRYLISGGRVELERSQDCPREIAVANAGTAAGVLLRSADDDQAAPLPPRPHFVLVGDGAEAVTKVRFFDGDEMVASVPVAERRVVWPEDSPALVAGTTYRVELDQAGGVPVERAVIAVEGRRDNLLIVRVD